MATQIQPRPTKDYNCAQAELYAATGLLWDSQEEHEAEFIAENTKYSPGDAVIRRAAIAAAQALPDGQARGAEAETLRITLIAKLDVVLGKWNSFDGYVKRAFTGDYYKPRIEEAGKQYYDKAQHKNWEHAKQLLVGMKNFLTTHNAVLLADGGMPAAFAASVDTVKTEFDGLYSDFKDAQQDSQEQTDVKILANNAIFADARLMMEDGKQIFRKNASVRDRFVWETVLELITPDTGTSEAVRQDDLDPGPIVNIDLTGVTFTANSRIIGEATGSTMRVFGSNGPNNGNTGGVFDFAAGTSFDFLVSDFRGMVNWNNLNTFLNIQNIGGATGHYKLKFTNLQN